MLLGILSDTHGRSAATAAALDALRQAGSEYFIHCGDVGGEPILDLMAGLPLTFVWGNTDWDRADLTRYAAKLGLSCAGDLADLQLGGRKIAVTHGDQPNLLKRIAADKKHDYLLHGHTHVARDETIKALRWINPGAVHRSPRPSVAVLDTETGKLRFIQLHSAQGD